MNINLDAVRRGDAHLARARHLLDGAPARTIPLDTITTTTQGRIMTDKTKLVFTAEEAADLLQVHPATVRQYIAAGDLVAVKLGRAWRIDRAALESFWRAQGGRALFADAAPDASDQEGTP